MYNFRVMYRLSDSFSSDSFSAPSMGALLRLLDQAENVNTKTAKELVVHWIRDSGEVVELLDFSKDRSDNAFTYTEPSYIESGGNVVVPFRKKPRVRMATVNPDNPVVSYACYGKYAIKEAK